MSQSSGLAGQAGSVSAALAAPLVKANTRMLAIDALRGFVMLLMLIDHVRETFLLHRQVTDPIDALSVTPDLYFTRMLSEICAPVFIFLTGLSAWLYSQKHTASETSVPAQARVLPGVSGNYLRLLRMERRVPAQDLVVAGDLVHRHLHDHPRRVAALQAQLADCAGAGDRRRA